jgi:exodeoxyribonuclease V alpha subunit
MAAKTEEITATFLREAVRRDDWMAGIVWFEGKEVSINGIAARDELCHQQTYRFSGKWDNHPRFGDRFCFDWFVSQQPHSEIGIITYLVNAGEGNGFGPVRARTCWDLYGGDAVKMMREQPIQVAADLVRKSQRITDEQAVKISEVLQREKALEASMIDLTELLNRRGFPKATARQAVREWGSPAVRIIRRNPYALMHFKGCGFKRCDALYLELGHDPARIRRQGLCAWYALARDTEGHTYYPVAFAENGIRGNVAAAKIDVEKALRFGRLAKIISEERTNGVKGPISPTGSARWLAEGKKARNESSLAEVIAIAAAEAPVWASYAAELTGITEHQREHLTRALQGTIGILGGSPGTGKTFALAALAKHLCRILGPESVLIGAPTGKAAVRVSENLSRYGLPLRARTWHSLLILLERFNSRHFGHKVLIGDETSMNDTDLMAAIFRARAAGTHVLLVGDVNQLPPVGHGAPLRDMIAAGLPYGELREIMRNSGGIVETCAAIRDGKPWSPGDNLRLTAVGNPERQISEMLAELKRQAMRDGINPIWDCQVVVPVNKKSPLARRELNKILQAELNPNGGTPGCPFREGDKIVNTKNGYFPIAGHVDLENEDTATNDRNEVYVANGELAEVLEVEDKKIIARLSNPDRTVLIPRGKAVEPDDVEASEDGGDQETTGTGCSWELGYALSVHKAQGSDWDVVIVMLDEYAGARMVCSREWIYTAISRAKKQCILIGKKEVAEAMCRKQAIKNRKTLLKERILLNKAALALVDM